MGSAAYAERMVYDIEFTESGPFQVVVTTSGKATAADQTFYLNAVAKSCRTCHDAFDPGVNWAMKSNFASDPDFQRALVCWDSGRAIPNAGLTYINFWLSDRPEMLTAFWGWPACPSP